MMGLSAEVRASSCRGAIDHDGCGQSRANITMEEKAMGCAGGDAPLRIANPAPFLSTQVTPLRTSGVFVRRPSLGSRGPQHVP